MHPPEIEMLMLGLDNAGKTKLLYTLQLGSVEDIIPTLGYNVESIEHKGSKYTIYDIGGLKSIRVLRNFYTDNKSAVMYVVDASDSERFEEARKDLDDVIAKNANLSDAVFLILANKMDLVVDFKIESLAENLNLQKLKQKWQIHGISAKEDGDKLYEIFDILKKMLNSSCDDD